MKKCPKCIGKGFAASGRECPACLGKGQVTEERFAELQVVLQRIYQLNNKKNSWAII